MTITTLEAAVDHQAANGHDSIQIGRCTVSFVPHHLPGVGPRVFLILDEPMLHEAIPMSTDDARRLAERLKLAACEAESKARRAMRRERQKT